MHILFLTDNFPPEVNAPAGRTFEHCREWVCTGHQVTVITCVPNFPKGKVHDGYKNKLWQSEMVEGIRVIRVWTYITPNKGFVKRILDYISYMVSAILASPFVKKPDLVVATSPQMFTAIAGYAVGGYRRIPFIFELRDLWPESIRAVGAMDDNSRIIQFLEKVELFLYRRADRIISLTNSFKHNLVTRGIDGDKIDVIPNGVDLDRFQPLEKDKELLKKHDLDGKFVAGYVGTHGMAHALETLLRAAGQIQKRGDGNKYRFILVGNGAEKENLVEKAREMELENVVFIDTVSREEVKRYWSLLDVSIIHLKNTPLFTTVIPSKLFEGMAMGVPVLHGVAGESAEIVETDGIGLIFEPENEIDLIEKLDQARSDKQLYQKMRSNCLTVAKGYNRIELANSMLHSLEKVVLNQQSKTH